MSHLHLRNQVLSSRIIYVVSNAIKRFAKIHVNSLLLVVISESLIAGLLLGTGKIVKISLSPMSCQRQLESDMATIRNAHLDGTPGWCGGLARPALELAEPGKIAVIPWVVVGCDWRLLGRDGW